MFKILVARANKKSKKKINFMILIFFKAKNGIVIP